MFLNSIPRLVAGLTIVLAGLASCSKPGTGLGPPSASTSTLIADPASALSDGHSPITLTFQVRDEGGHLLPGTNVTFSSSGVADTLVPSSGVTDSAGMFVA